MFCSTIIPTIGRPTLSRAVESVLNQRFTADDYEIIVVNDSGKPLPWEDWQGSSQVRLIHTNRRNRSVARNAGAAIARAKYLHFLDDDDWMLPNALDSLWEIANVNKAAWIYGGFQSVNNAGKKLFELHPAETGNCLVQMLSFEWIPLQASLIESKAFFSAGGFASLESLLGGFEDIDLSRQISRHGDMARTTEIVAVIRVGIESSTTNYNYLNLQNRRSREKLFDAPAVFMRLRDSAKATAQNSDYWCGRITYSYLGSARWNLRHWRLTKAASRGVFAVASLGAAGRYLLSRGFWRALGKPHFHRFQIALEEAEVTDLYDGIEWKWD